jgi:hypothetical protein
MKLALQILTIGLLFTTSGLSMILSFNDFTSAQVLASLHDEWYDIVGDSHETGDELGDEQIPSASVFWIPFCLAFAVIPLCALAIYAAVSVKRKLGFWIAPIMIVLAVLLYWLQPTAQFPLFPFENHHPLAVLDAGCMFLAAMGLLILVIRYSPKND